jgi:hypothetical protein
MTVIYTWVRTFDQVLEPCTMAMVSPGTFHFSIRCCTRSSNSGFIGEIELRRTILNTSCEEEVSKRGGEGVVKL